MTKKVLFRDWLSKYVKSEYMDVEKIFLSPDNKFAIVEVFKSELFVAIMICEENENGIIGQYKGSYEVPDTDVAFWKFDVDWSLYEEHGMAKLKCKKHGDYIEEFNKRFMLK